MSSMEVLDNKINFLISMTEEIREQMNLNFDFNMFVIKNNLTSTDVVLIIKALTVMGYRNNGVLDSYISDFEGDKRFEKLLNNNKPTFCEFEEFVRGINPKLDAKILLENLKKQQIGEKICKFLLEDQKNN